LKTLFSQKDSDQQTSKSLVFFYIYYCISPTNSALISNTSKLYYVSNSTTKVLFNLWQTLSCKCSKTKLDIFTRHSQKNIQS